MGRDSEHQWPAFIVVAFDLQLFREGIPYFTVLPVEDLKMSRAFLIGTWLLIATSAFGADKYALLIGISKYDHAEMNKPEALKYPEEDAKALAPVLTKGGYEVEILLGKDATREQIDAKFAKLTERGTSDGVVLIGLFGHGVEVETLDADSVVVTIGCFCPFDTKLREVKDSKGRIINDRTGHPLIEPDPDSLIKLSDLMIKLKLAKAGNRVVLADCCRTVPNQARGRSFGAGFRAQDLPENTSVLFGCSPNEKAFEHKEWGHGAFTKCVLEAMTELSVNGQVSTASLADSLKHKVPRLVQSVAPREHQTPKLFSTDSVDLQLTVSLPFLVAPFDQNMARSAQERWAKSLGTDVVSKNGVISEMVVIPPGEFLMGNEDSVEDLPKMFPNAKQEWLQTAKRRHRVRITKPFLLSKYEVTIRHFQEFVEATGYVTDAEKDDKGGWGYDSKTKQSIQQKRFNWRNAGFEPRPSQDSPVVNISWHDAIAFCNWLSRKEGKKEYYRIQATDVTVLGGSGYRIPTEAEWEYACRAGTITIFSNGSVGERLVHIANVRDAMAKTKEPTIPNPLSSTDGFAFTSPVGRFNPNNFGLYDMTGNVYEWCNDWFSSDYDSTVVDDPIGAAKGSERVNRGGSWFSIPAYCRSAFRGHNLPDHRLHYLGFRLSAFAE